VTELILRLRSASLRFAQDVILSSSWPSLTSRQLLRRHLRSRKIPVRIIGIIEVLITVREFLVKHLLEIDIPRVLRPNLHTLKRRGYRIKALRNRAELERTWPNSKLLCQSQFWSQWSQIESQLCTSRREANSDHFAVTCIFVVLNITYLRSGHAHVVTIPAITAKKSIDQKCEPYGSKGRANVEKSAERHAQKCGKVAVESGPLVGRCSGLYSCWSPKCQSSCAAEYEEQR